MIARQRESLFEERRALPIFAARAGLMETIRKNQTTVIVGETGSGKTTQIPQYLVEDGLIQGAVAITQPRRVAAMTVARRVAVEHGAVLGDRVGYSVRFDECSSARTRIKFLTDGMLLMEAIQDPTLSRYDVVVLDEAHERTLSTDILFGIVKRVQTKRPEMKIIVMSATLEADRFAKFFGAPIVYVEGRQHPVDVFYTPESQEDFLDAALITIIQIQLEEKPGDVLVFLPGQEDIENLQKLLEDRSPRFPPQTPKLIVAPLFAALPPDMLMNAFEPTPDGCRKIILATNIAETSVTIKGVRYVVDTGVVKARIYNSRTGIDALQVVPVSKASAEQRCGRAGREAPGKCFRLFTEDTYETLELFAVPEIKRVGLAEYVLKLMALGINDVVHFSMVDTPPVNSVIKAMELLYSLGALDDTGSLVDPVGKQMAAMPLTPMASRALLASQELGCCKDMLSMIAMLSADNVFFAPKGQRDTVTAARRQFASYDGDHVTYVHLYGAFTALHGAHDRAAWCKDHFMNMRSMRRVMDIRNQLVEICQRFGMDTTSSCLPDTAPLRQALVTGYVHHTARKQPDGTYMTFSDRQIARIHPSSVLAGWRAPEYIVYNELILTTKKYLRDVSDVDPAHLQALGVLSSPAGGDVVPARVGGAGKEKKGSGARVFTHSGRFLGK